MCKHSHSSSSNTHNIPKCSLLYFTLTHCISLFFILTPCVLGHQAPGPYVINPSNRLDNYWLDPAHIDRYRRSKFRAYENCSDLRATISGLYEAVVDETLERVLNETEHVDVSLLDTNETARLGNSKVDTLVKKYFYFKSKYYFEINTWYYDIVFNMRKYFKDKHKYLGRYPAVQDLVGKYEILNYERDMDLLFNNIAYKYRSKISTQMKSLRIKFYYVLNMIQTEERCAMPEFRDVIRFAMGKHEI